MIIGLGIDIIDIQRIEKVINRFGNRFTKRVFTDEENETARKRLRFSETYAKRWAAKEACSKALGTGLRMGVAWKEMSISNLSTGKPVLSVSGSAAKRLDIITPVDHRSNLNLSITDEYPYAKAIVIIEAIPE